jgi:Tol biopolymer transport system component
MRTRPSPFSAPRRAPRPAHPAAGAGPVLTPWLALLLLAGAGWTQTTWRLSVGAGGAQSNGLSTYPILSADGRYLAFQSAASNLVPGDTNLVQDVFVRDLQNGTNERVSVDSLGNEVSVSSTNPAISADGRFVAFHSLATNLVPGDTNGTSDVFVRDRQSGSTERVSLSSGGGQAQGHSAEAALSADGRFVAFQSGAANLVAGDTNGAFDVFVRDRQSGTTERVSVGPGGVQSNGGSFDPKLSADGRFVAFESQATNLVSGDTNAGSDIFVFDRLLGTTERVSVSTAGAQGNGFSIATVISADGRFVVFESYATNLVAGDTNAADDIFVRDRQLGTTERVNVDSSGAQSNGSAEHAAISADGRFVAFVTTATNLGPGDTSTLRDVYLRDLQLGLTTRASTSWLGGPGNAECLAPSLPADGSFVVFPSSADNLVLGDSNFSSDIFAHDSDASGFASVCEPGVGGVIVCPCSNPPSGSGHGCNNSSATGGASLAAVGVAHLSADTLVFGTYGELPTATSIVLQGNAEISTGAGFGQGVRCAGGSLKRLYVKTASGGIIIAPNTASGDPTVSARSAARGDPIGAGQSRWYLVYYRDPVVLGGCPAASTFNATPTGRVDWSL